MATSSLLCMLLTKNHKSFQKFIQNTDYISEPCRNARLFLSMILLLKDLLLFICFYHRRFPHVTRTLSRIDKNHNNYYFCFLITYFFIAFLINSSRRKNATYNAGAATVHMPTLIKIVVT